MPGSSGASTETVERFSMYRVLLSDFLEKGTKNVYSYQVAAAAGVKASQVRRDIMTLHYSGNPQRGYDVARLIETIDSFLDAPDGQNIALIGVGNIGRAVANYFLGRRPKLRLVALFDIHPDKQDRLYNGIPCYGPDRLSEVIRNKDVSIVILSVPASEAQAVTDVCVEGGALGILNFAPVALQVPREVFVENLDMTKALEKVAYFARQSVRWQAE